MKKTLKTVLVFVLALSIATIGCSKFRPVKNENETAADFKQRQIAILFAQSATYGYAASQINGILLADEVISQTVSNKIADAQNKIIEVQKSAKAELVTGVITQSTREKARSVARFAKDLNSKDLVFKDALAKAKFELIIDQLALTAENLADLLEGKAPEKIQTKIEEAATANQKALKAWPALVATVVSNAALRAFRQGNISTEQAFAEFDQIANETLTKNNSIIKI